MPVFREIVEFEVETEVAPLNERQDLVEEPMDYSPIIQGHLAAPDAVSEAWTDDDSGPMGF